MYISVRHGLTVDNTFLSDTNDVEILSIKLLGISVSSVYKPPAIPFDVPSTATDNGINILIGDFNSHSAS